MKTSGALFLRAQEEIIKLTDEKLYEERYRMEEVWYSKQVIEMLHYETAKDRKIKNILDIGAGFGTMTLYCTYLYPDANIYSLDMVRKNPVEGVKHEIMDIEYDELPRSWPKKFDIIIMTEVLEHLKHNPITTLKKIHDILPNNGVLFLSTPDAKEWGRVTEHYNHIGEMSEPDPENRVDLDTHVYQYSEGEVLYIFDKSGFKVDQMHFSTPPYWGRHMQFKLLKK